ncbi:hypothetical protein [Ensifer aridi]|uniref:hypothetical protein n=1 Tax=Ensifer aridi TaxID=1708715 RepID=UPI001FCD1418|nr:hypothetical protein [Ensifer aridi]
MKLVWIDESKATAEALKDGFLSLARQGPFELCWVFLSGHGWVDETSAGFLVQPDGTGVDLPLLHANTLDQLLSEITAERTILVLDCCLAEGVVRRMPFFTALGPSVARLYVASSREQQRTWEDDGVQHGVFSAHLLDLLNNGSAAQLGARKTQLDVDAELFPTLCEQVPLYVLEHKNGAHQEPVKGGVSSSAVTLPVASAARRVRDRTALGTAIRRLRQIMTGLAVGAVALLLLTYTLVYYIEPGATGVLIVRHGTRWLTHNTDQQRGRGARERVRSAVAEVLGVIATARVDRGFAPLDPSDRMLLRHLAAIGYGDVINQALSHVPTERGARVAARPVAGMTIVVGSGPWLVALAEYGRTRELPAHDVELLREHVADPALRDLLVPALVRQEGVEPVKTAVGSWVARLAALRLDARARGVEQAIIASALAARPRTAFDLLLERLRTARADTREPELRIALGAIIVEAQIGRARGCLDPTNYARKCTLPAF